MPLFGGSVFACSLDPVLTWRPCARRLQSGILVLLLGTTSFFILLGLPCMQGNKAVFRQARAASPGLAPSLARLHRSMHTHPCVCPSALQCSGHHLTDRPRVRSSETTTLPPSFCCCSYASLGTAYLYSSFFFILAGCVLSGEQWACKGWEQAGEPSGVVGQKPQVLALGSLCQGSI